MQSNSKTIALILGVILLLATCLRLPFVYEGSPYMHREDEAHHFNRILNMMKSGNLDPDYFHKPSLHFYLRLPVAAAAFLYSVKKSEVTEVKQIITSDPFGLADYSFSASHPRILHISRTFSLLLSLGTIALIFIICLQLNFNLISACSAALLLSISPSAIRESCVIGVDGPMTFFAVWSVYLAIRAYKLNSTLALFWCAAAAGLTISCKYNALPIIAVPLTVLLLNKNFSLERCLTVLFIPVFFFLLGSPYLVLSLPKFLNQFGYEIWHYGVAGHVGHMSNPGLDQLIFYATWLAKDGLGLLATLLMAGGLFLILRKSDPLLRLMSIFPVLFFLLMLGQKANFERNMLVFLPFASIFCAYVLNLDKNKLLIKSVFIISLLQPLYSSTKLSLNTANIEESRVTLKDKLKEITEQQKPVAIDGELQIERSILDLPAVDRVNFSQVNYTDLFQQGYKTLIVSDKNARLFANQKLFTLSEQIQGNNETQRIVINPGIIILKANSNLTDIPSELRPEEYNFDLSGLSYGPEGLIWITSSVANIKLHSYKDSLKARIRLFSPWTQQKCGFFINGKAQNIEFADKNEIEIEISLSSENTNIQSICQKVHSPLSLGISSDSRKLAFAIKNISIE